MKRLLAILSAVLMTLFAVSCQNASTAVQPAATATTLAPAKKSATTAAAATTAASVSTVASAAASDDTINITVWRNAKSQSGISELKYGESKVGALNVAQDHVDCTIYYSTGDPNTDFNLKVADGNWEDIICMGKDDVKINTLLDNNAVLPLDKYFNDPANYPNLAQIPKEALNYWRASDGKIYNVPVAWFDEGAPIFWLAAGWYVEPGIAGKVGISLDSIKTTDDVKNFLIAVKNANLKTGDGLDVIPLTGGAALDGLGTFLSTFGIDIAGTGYSKINGVWTHFRDNPQFKAALKFLNDLYLAGVIDKEYTTITNDQLVERLMGSRAAMVVGNAWPFWSTVTAGETPVTKLEMIKFPSAPGAAKIGTMMTVNPYGSLSAMLSAKTQYADRIMKWFDHYAEKGKFRDWEGDNGPIGKLWDWDPARNGSPTNPYFKITDAELIQAKNAGDYNKMEAYGWQMLNFVPAPYKYDLNQWVEGNEGLAWIFKMNSFWSQADTRYYEMIRPMDMISIPPDGAIVSNNAALGDVDKQYEAALITAANSAEFDKVFSDYRNELESKGKWSEVNAEFQAMYKDLN